MGEKGNGQQKTRVSFLERVPNKSPEAAAASTLAKTAALKVQPMPPSSKVGVASDQQMLPGVASEKSGEEGASRVTPPAATASASQALSATAIKGLLSAALSGGPGGAAAAAEMFLARQLQQQAASGAPANQGRNQCRCEIYSKL